MIILSFNAFLFIKSPNTKQAMATFTAKKAIILEHDSESHNVFA